MSIAEKTVSFMVRHGDVYNPNHIYYGRLPNFHLSDYGRERVQILGECLKGRNISAIYTSPLERTFETADILSRYFPPTPIITDTRLLEVHSIYDGTPWEQMDEIDFNFYSQQSVDRGGETLPEVIHRVNQAMNDILDRHQGEEVLVVSHGDPVMIMRAKYMNIPLSFDALRDGYYVQRANGIQITFGEQGVLVNDIIPQEK